MLCLLCFADALPFAFAFPAKERRDKQPSVFDVLNRALGDKPSPSSNNTAPSPTSARHAAGEGAGSADAGKQAGRKSLNVQVVDVYNEVSFVCRSIWKGRGGGGTK